jgi:hypothetical protein
MRSMPLHVHAFSQAAELLPRCDGDAVGLRTVVASTVHAALCLVCVQVIGRAEEAAVEEAGGVVVMVVAVEVRQLQRHAMGRRRAPSVWPMLIKIVFTGGESTPAYAAVTPQVGAVVDESCECARVRCAYMWTYGCAASRASRWPVLLYTAAAAACDG